MSRPELPIDWDRVDDLLAAGCFGNEIAAVFGMHQNTFYDRVLEKFKVTFTEYSQAKRARGEAALREVQFNKAIGVTKKGDNTMLIWLGKQRLNQRESVSEFTVSPETFKPFEAVMGQISNLQTQRKISLIKDKSAPKSE